MTAAVLFFTPLIAGVLHGYSAKSGTLRVRKMLDQIEETRPRASP